MKATTANIIAGTVIFENLGSMIHSKVYWQICFAVFLGPASSGPACFQHFSKRTLARFVTASPSHSICDLDEADSRPQAAAATRLWVSRGNPAGD